MAIKIKNWRSSWAAFKEAIEFTKSIGKPVTWLIVGQVVLMLVAILLIAVFTKGENIYSQVYGGALEPAVQGFIIFLGIVYGLIYTMAVMHLVLNPQRSLVDVLKTSVLVKLVPAFGALVLLMAGSLLSTALLIVPGIIFYGFFSFMLYVLILEDTGIFEAFKRSYRYVHGWWWLILGRLTLMFAVMTVVTFFSIVPVYGLIVTYILTLFLTPVFLVYFTQTYLELRKAKKASAKAGLGIGHKLILFFGALVVFVLFAAVSLASDFVREVGVFDNGTRGGVEQVEVLVP